ncbi:hypothetical protein COP1_018624 [Malus domestica]
MLGLDRTLVEYELCIKASCKPFCLPPRRFSTEIFIAEADVHKNAFRCPGALGTYEWVIMPFDLKNAGATYQRAMNIIFHDLIGTIVEVYIDDVVIKSARRHTHLDNLRQACLRMRRHNLKMNPAKCAFDV